MDSGAALVARHGSVACFARTPRRRIAELDSHGTLLAAYRWDASGRLLSATTRIPAGPWLTIEPRATDSAPWGASDRIWAGPRPHVRAVPITLFEAVDYARPGIIPTLAEPARLPPHGGIAVLNMIATLAADAGVPLLRYRGPYPGEQLFLALLECFHHAPASAPPLAAFTGGDLDWQPAPHERRFAAGGTYVQLRDRVEKVVHDGRMYVRADWQAVRRHAPHRVRDAPDGVVCSLVVLDTVVEDHLVLDPDGTRIRVLDVPAAAEPADRMADVVAAALVAIVAARSVPPLAPFIRALAGRLALEWGPVDRDLVRVAGDRVRVAASIRALVGRRLRAANDRAARMGIGLAALAEIAALIGDALRARAQAAVAALPAAEQAATLEREGGAAEDPADARRIAAGVEAIVDACASEGGDHQPGVEGHERRDGDR